MTSAIDTDQKTHLYSLISQADLHQSNGLLTQVVCSVTRPPTKDRRNQRQKYSLTTRSLLTNGTYCRPNEWRKAVDGKGLASLFSSEAVAEYSATQL